MLKELPKDNPNKRIGSGADSKMSKVKEPGFNQTQAERFQILAANPDVIEQVKAEKQLQRCN